MFDGWPRPSVRAPASVTRFPGTVSGTCGIGSRSPWPPPFAPPPPLPVARPCSAASLLLWRSLTSHARASSASVPHLPDADQAAQGLWSATRYPSFRRVPFERDRVFDLGRASAPRIAVPHMLPSTFLTASASAMFKLRGSIADPTRSLCTLRPCRHRHDRNTRYQAAATPYLGGTFARRTAPASLAH